MSAICSSLRGSGESEYPQVTTLGGMREVCGKVARRKAELGESGMQVIARR
jgi:hypothetical protein